MNVNGSRFHLLLGEADWGKCFVQVDKYNNDANHARLKDAWSNAAMPFQPLTSPPTTIDPPQLAWDVTVDELCLQSELIEIKPTLGETTLKLSARRSSAADGNGNIYWIGAAPTQLRVWSVGSDRESAFWPEGVSDCNAIKQSDFGDFQPTNKIDESRREFNALAVTEDHYLIVTFTSSAKKGLLAFDLMAGGPPVETLWPALTPFAPFDMVQRHCGGVWILDRDNAGLWELDRNLTVVSRTQVIGTNIPQEQAFFQAINKTQNFHAESRQSFTAFPSGINLIEAIGEQVDPIAVEVSQDGIVFILDRNQTAGSSRIFCLKLQDNEYKAIKTIQLSQLAHDFVVAKTHTRITSASASQLLVVTATGNQALAFDIIENNNSFELQPSRTLFPLRLFGGRALLKVRNKAWYDSGIGDFRWIPIVHHPRAKYKDYAELITPVFDGLEIQCVWDRLMLDACIPPDSSVEVLCRASDEAVRCEHSPQAEMLNLCEILSPWKVQPKLYLRSDGSELPWMRSEAMHSTKREAGVGTWELSLQNMLGRYLQIKLVIRGNGMVTPRLRALRVWYPRFSYSKRFLPAVYREDPVSGDFIERFLANMEGINTAIEDRIAQMQALFDPRTAPTETLAWLASWFDVALDPTWDEHRRRQFIKHAMTFFRWRGTVHGLRLALSIAFENYLVDNTFADPNPDTLHLQAIRIVETYLTRKVGAVVAGDAGAVDNNFIQQVKLNQLWTPQEGNEGLQNRYANFLDKTLTATEQLKPFELVPPPEVDMQKSWRQFCEQNLGFVPSVGATDRQNWERFLMTHQTLDDDLEPIQLDDAFAKYPSDWPNDQLVQEKWRAYTTLPDANRMRWQDFLARRYRRIGKLNAAYQTNWPAFDLVAFPDHLPATKAAQTDWLQFERNLMAFVRTAHRFSVLLPVSVVTENPNEMERKVKLARRIVELEKPAHTVFDVRFYWALNRIGEARLGLDTLIDVGSRAPQLIPNAVLGRAYLGASFVGGTKPPTDGDRHLLTC